MSTAEKRVVRRSFSLTEKDLETLKQVVERCGYVSDSEAIRAIIRFYAEHAQCIKT
jgi:metal-responsive CopG/Arc/MetJ family transcriptional regulator